VFTKKNANEISYEPVASNSKPHILFLQHPV